MAARAWNAVLAGDREDMEANHALANVYERLHKLHADPADLERSNQAIRNLLERHDLSSVWRAEALALEGRNLKTLWRLDFAKLDTQEARRERAIGARALDAYDAYRKAYRVDLNHYYSGLAALQMGRILISLSQSARFKNLFAGKDRKAAVPVIVTALHFTFHEEIQVMLRLVLCIDMTVRHKTKHLQMVQQILIEKLAHVKLRHVMLNRFFRRDQGQHRRLSCL
ncbi:MAG: hypothetical protein HC794_09505 [Nitrospiraceae bacterium]|nr:hypothetical protein [Nitrospiraceae bacterium]